MFLFQLHCMKHLLLFTKVMQKVQVHLRYAVMKYAAQHSYSSQ